MMTLPQFMARVEGIELKPYDMEPDIAGVDTIGIGHLLTDDEHDTGQINIAGMLVPWRNGITKEQAELLLMQDLAEYVASVKHAVRVPLTDNQQAALVSFAFNVGTGAFTRSTLLAKLNAGDFAAVPAELARWNKQTYVVDGKKVKRVVPGLTNRRNLEIRMWSGTL